ncbi:MAG TPA: ABC transporter permease [Bryobacteraceae bacterium]|nr:ABC transporter permease [Bryobacteraceae bacterium]
MRRMWSKLLAFFRPGYSPSELDEEMGAHFDFEVEENIKAGLPPEEARRAAGMKFGNRALARESVYESWRFAWFEALLQDARYCLRCVRKSPASSLILILTLALGIGANTAIFSVVNSVLLNPLPYPDSERLVWLGESFPKGSGIAVTWVNYKDWLADNRTFETMSAYDFPGVTVTGHGEPVLVRAGRVTSEFFPLLGVRPLFGRLPNADDDKPGAPLVTVLAYDFWRNNFSSERKLVGSTLAINGKAFEVIGVAAPHFQFYGKADLYIPAGPVFGTIHNRAQHGSLHVLGRLRPGVTLADARKDLDGIMQRLAVTDPGPESTHRSAAIFLNDIMSSGIRPTLLVLMGAACLVLLIACANVANLLLARGSVRIQEISIRVALGAAANRIARQLLTESLVLVGVGGLAGVALAYWGLRMLVASRPPGLARVAAATLDSRVLLFALAVTLFTGLIAGVGPAFHAVRRRGPNGLNQGSRSSTDRRSRQLFRNALVSAEIAITLALAFAAGLLIRSLAAAQNRDPGFRPDHLLALELSLPPTLYAGDDAIRAFYSNLEQELRALPGVSEVGLVSCRPAGGDCGDWFYSVPGKPVPAKGDEPLALFDSADSDYFRSVGTPLLQGRPFTSRDVAKGVQVAIVNEKLARTWWPNRTAVGTQIKVGGPYRDGAVLEIVGVVGNVSQLGLDTEVAPHVFTPTTQVIGSSMAVMIRTQPDPELLIPAVRARVHAIDRDLPIRSLRSSESLLAESLDRRRFGARLLALFAALAIVLAAVGAYGVLSCWVASRETEIAVRMAIGATRSSVLSLIGSHAARLAAWGAGVGLIGAWAASRYLAHLVFGVSPQSATVASLAIGVVAIVTTAATIVPAWRAARVDPAVKLHGS